MPSHYQPNADADIKIRSWGPGGLYGISPLSSGGLKWAESWLRQQSFFQGIHEDGAFLFHDYFRDQVAVSALSHELTANAGVGPEPDEGEPFELNDWVE